MNQPNHYMASTAQSGYTRRYFSANYPVEADSINDTESAEQPFIVLCIDRNSADQQPCATDQKSAPDAVTNTFEAAIALAEQDPLLQYVASWLNQDLQWQPMQLNPSIAVDVTLSSVHIADHRIGLSFGHSAKDLPLPPTELNDLVVVQEHNRSLSVCVTQLQLSADDKQRLQPGSCIVLPDTFKETYTLNLFDSRCEKIVAQAVLDRCQNALIQLTNGSLHEPDNSAQTIADSPVQTAPTLTRVFLEQPVAVDMSVTSTSIELAPLVGQLVAVQCSGPDGVENYVARLIEVGSGLAALLEST